MCLIYPILNQLCRKILELQDHWRIIVVIYISMNSIDLSLLFHGCKRTCILWQIE
jgi:hypothetical protein